MAEKVDPLRRLFLEISQQISFKDERSLKGLVKGKQIPIKDLEGLADGNELFIKLEELGCIGKENLILLKELLGSIKREPLVRLVEEFERKQQGNQSISQQHDVNKDFDEFQREPIVHLVEESETRQHGSQSVSQQAEHGNQSVGQQDGLDTDLDEFQQEPVVQSVEESETIQHGSQSISQQHRNQNVGQQDGLTTESPGISTADVHQSIPPRSRGQSWSIVCEAHLEIVEKIMKMETERERQQLELQRDKKQLKFKEDTKKMLRAKLEELYDREVEIIVAKNSPDVQKELQNAFKEFKAQLDALDKGSLQFMLSFLSEEDIDYFWQKYKAAEVEEVISNILITPEMRSLAEEAGFTVRIKLKIDKHKYELVKGILHDISAVYTFSKKTWVRTVALNEWERYVLNHVHENQAEYLIQQSRLHPILSELKDDEFFFPSFVSYLYENMYNLPSTLTEATEYAINYHLQQYCKGQKMEIILDEVKMLYEIGKQALPSFLQSSGIYEHTCALNLLDHENLKHLMPFFKRPPHSVHIWCQHIYCYALAVYLCKTQDVTTGMLKEVFAKCITSTPIIVYFISGILREKSKSFTVLLVQAVRELLSVNFDSLSLLGHCLHESQHPEEFTELIQQLLTKQDLVLYTENLDSISHSSLEAVALILKLTHMIQDLVFIYPDDRSYLSVGFSDFLKYHVESLPSSVECTVKDMLELTIVSKCIAFHQLLIAKKYPLIEDLSQTVDVLDTVSIKGVDDMSYDKPIRVVQMLVRALALCPLLRSLHLSGFNQAFVIKFLHAVIYKREIITVKNLELPQNKLDSSVSKTILEAITFCPFLETLDVTNNNLECTGIVTLLPLVDKINILLENNVASVSIDTSIKGTTLAEEIGDLQPYMSDIKTLHDVHQLQIKSAHVTRLRASAFSFEIVNFLCLKLALFFNLKELDFSCCGITGGNAMILADTFEYLIDLERVNLSSNNIGDEGVVQIAVKLASLRKFTSADLSETNISLRGIIMLHHIIGKKQRSKFNIASNMKGLIYLSSYIEDKFKISQLDVDLEADQLSLDKLTWFEEVEKACEKLSVNKQWEREEFKYFCQGLRGLGIVRSLDLSHGNIVDVGTEYFCEIMEWLPELTNLFLRHNNIGDAAAQSIIRGLVKMRCLDHLDLSHNNIQDFSVVSMVKGIDDGYMLRHIDLSNNNIGIVGSENLSKVMGWFPNLESLSLNHNSIGDEGSKRLSIGIVKLTNLKNLGLSHNDIGDVGAEEVIRQIGKSKNLEHFDLSHNKIGDSFAEILSEVINSMARSVRQDHGHASNKVMHLKYVDLRNNCITNSGAHLLISTIENVDSDLSVDLGESKIGNFSEYLGKKRSSRSDKAPTTAVCSTSMIVGSSIEPKHSSMTAASHSDSGFSRLSFPASTGSTDGKEMPFMMHNIDSSCATSGVGDSCSSAVTDSPATRRKHSYKTAASHSDSALGQSSFPASTDSIGGTELSLKELDIDSSSATSGRGTSISHCSAKSKEGLDLESDVHLDV